IEFYIVFVLPVDIWHCFTYHLFVRTVVNFYIPVPGLDAFRYIKTQCSGGRSIYYGFFAAYVNRSDQVQIFPGDKDLIVPAHQLRPVVDYRGGNSDLKIITEEC